jgi:hypothetical protein
MPGNPRECGEHAKNCLRLAGEAGRPEAKAHFEGLTKRWIELATDLEATQVLLNEMAVPARKPSD